MLKEYDLGHPAHFPTIFADPYPIYQQLRTHAPVHLDRYLGCWVVTSYAEVTAALANRDLSSERSRQEVALRENGWSELAPLFQHIANLMFFSDPPKHTRLRGLVGKNLSARMIEKWRTFIQRNVNSLLDAVQHTGRMDIIHDLALPLPMMVISNMLGVPSYKHAQFKHWSDELVYFLGNALNLHHCQQLWVSLQEFTNYFRGVVQQHMLQPKDNLLNALIQTEEQGVMLTEDELLMNCVGLFAGGHETTTNLIGNGLLALLQHPEAMSNLQSDPSLIESAVEEFLRYDSPVQFTARVVKQTTEIGGQKIHKGQHVMLMLGAANRDPLKFIHPDHLDISRQENKHLAFGHNIHYCIGAALARLETQIAITTVLQRMPNIRIEQIESMPLKWQENLSFHGLKSLPVVF